MLAIFLVYTIACFPTSAFVMYCMSSFSADNLSKKFCNDLRHHPWVFCIVLFLQCFTLPQIDTSLPVQNPLSLPDFESAQPN